jgi:O-antigen/teichoic acid export membrane protein
VLVTGALCSAVYLHQPAVTVMSETSVLAKGVLWIGSFRWAAQVLSWLSTLVVIRLLSPSDYGIVGMALTWIGVASVVSELGLGAAVVALPRLSSREAAQLHVVAIAAGITMAGISLLAAPIIAAFFREPILNVVVPVLSALFVLESGRTVPVALLSRQLEYRTVALMEFGRAVGTTVAVLSFALMGYGYWSLVFGSLIGTGLASGWALWIVRPAYLWPSWSELSTPIQYSRHIVVNRLAWQIYINADYVIVGRLLGVQALGLYAVARNLSALPAEKLGNVVTAAAGPFFAAIRADRQKLRHYVCRVTEVLCITLHPVLIGFCLVADLAVPIALGAQWTEAVPALRILLVYATLHSATTLLHPVLLVTGHTRIAMHAALLTLFVLVPGFVIGAQQGGARGAALVWLMSFPIVIAWPLRTALRAIDVKMTAYLALWRPAAEAVAVMMVAVILARSGAQVVRCSLETELAVAVAVGAVAYIMMVRVRHPFIISEAIRLALRKDSTAQRGGRDG